MDPVSTERLLRRDLEHCLEVFWRHTLLRLLHGEDHRVARCHCAQSICSGPCEPKRVTDLRHHIPVVLALHRTDLPGEGVHPTESLTHVSQRSVAHKIPDDPGLPLVEVQNGQNRTERMFHHLGRDARDPLL